MIEKNGSGNKRLDGKPIAERKNFHPTVKPQPLLSYLVNLITPKGGTVLDPFMGLGSTCVACMHDRFDFVGMELEKEYFDIAKERIEYAEKHRKNKLF